MPKQLDWTLEVSKRFWDYTSQFPEQYFTFQFGGNIIKKLKKFLKGKRTVLYYGCGTVFLIPHLLKEGFEVTGLVFSGKSLEFVNEKFKDAPHFHGAKNIDELEKEVRRFDAIFIIEVIEHLSDQYLDATLKNVKKFLAPNGVVIFTTPNNEDLKLSTVCCPSCQTEFHRWQHVQSLTKETLEQFLKQHDFSVIACGVTDFSASFFKNRKNYVKYIAKRMLRIPPASFLRSKNFT